VTAETLFCRRADEGRWVGKTFLRKLEFNPRKPALCETLVRSVVRSQGLVKKKQRRERADVTVSLPRRRFDAARPRRDGNVEEVAASASGSARSSGD
jgi:hypothetical protein